MALRAMRLLRKVVGPMPDSVAQVLRPSSPVQVFDAVVRRVAVTVQNFISLRGRAGERDEYQAVQFPLRGLPVPA